MQKFIALVVTIGAVSAACGRKTVEKDPGTKLLRAVFEPPKPAPKRELKLEGNFLRGDGVQEVWHFTPDLLDVYPSPCGPRAYHAVDEEFRFEATATCASETHKMRSPTSAQVFVEGVSYFQLDGEWLTEFLGGWDDDLPDAPAWLAPLRFVEPDAAAVAAARASVEAAFAGKGFTKPPYDATCGIEGDGSAVHGEPSQIAVRYPVRSADNPYREHDLRIAFGDTATIVCRLDRMAPLLTGERALIMLSGFLP
jgi:hypothetical protein